MGLRVAAALSIGYLLCSALAGNAQTPGLIESPDTPLQNAAFYTTPHQELTLHNPNAPYGMALLRCLYADSPASSCRLGELPLLGQELALKHPKKEEPVSAPQLLNRLAVSHSWMGKRLAEILPLLPPEIFYLFRGINGIVIATTIGRTMYSPYGGILYLSPHSLWLTAAEQSTISASRAGNSQGEGLRFKFVSRYLIDGKEVSADKRQFLRDLVLPLSRELYHFLALANDYIPTHRYPDCNPQLTFFQQTQRFASERPSMGLTTSIIGYREDLAAVLRRQRQDQALQQLSPENFSRDFQTDSVNDLKAYRSPQDHLAYLSEELFMLYRFNADREIAIVTKDKHENVIWGQRNRIRQSALFAGADLNRDANYLLHALLPEALARELREQPGARKSPRPLVPGKPWRQEAPPRPQNLTAVAAVSAG